MIKESLFIKKHKEPLYLIGCLAFYCLLAFLFKIPCPIRKITGISCPGCGMSRAMLSFVTMDFSMAAYYHPLVFFVIPIVICFVVFYERNMCKARKILIIVSVVGLLVVYLYRMIIIQSSVLQFNPKSGSIIRFLEWIVSFFWLNIP